MTSPVATLPSGTPVRAEGLPHHPSSVAPHPQVRKGIVRWRREQQAPNPSPEAIVPGEVYRKNGSLP